MTTLHALTRFRIAYAQQRAAEGRATDDPVALPYVEHGPHVGAWKVRARTFEKFLAVTVAECAAAAGGRPLCVADIGAGNGWLCYRLQLMGHEAVAIDLRDDTIDGLGAARAYEPRLGRMFARAVASLQSLPLRPRTCDIVVFNAALHYATALDVALAEAAAALRPGGRIAVLDSPFYEEDAAGAAMVVEKHALAGDTFGERAADLLGLPFIEYLTRERLEHASARLALHWTRHRVRYPLRYELRPALAALRGRRAPSRFDLWEATVQ